MSRHLERGFALNELKRFSEAAREFAKVAGGPEANDPIAHAALSLTALQLERLGEAKRHLRQARRLGPDHPVLQLAAANVALRQQRFGAARNSMRAALRHDPNDPDLLHLSALVELAANDLAQYLVLAERALAINPVHDGALETALFATHGLNDPVAFSTYLIRLRQISPLSAAPHILMAQDAIFDDDLNLARQHVVEALRLDPEDLTTHAIRINCEAVAHPVFRLCQGWIGAWRAPVWLRILACFAPLLCLIVVAGTLGLTPPRWLNAACLPFVPLALAVSILLGWSSWWLLGRALHDKSARKIVRFAWRPVLVSAVLPAVLAVSQGAFAATGLSVAGLAFLSVFLLCVWMLAGAPAEPVRLAPGPRLWLVGGAFLAGLVAQIATNVSDNAWPGKLLWALNLAALGAMLLLTPKHPPTSSPSKRAAAT